MAQFNKTVKDIRINFSASNNFLKKIKKKEKNIENKNIEKYRKKNIEKKEIKIDLSIEV